MSKLCYVHVFCLHYTLYTTNCTQQSWSIGTFVRRTQQIQDIIWLTNQIKIIYTKIVYNTSIAYMHQSWTWVLRVLFIQQLEIIYKLGNTTWTTLGNKLTLLDIGCEYNATKFSAHSFLRKY